MLPKSSRLRRILLAYTVNELGTWFGYIALALGVYDNTHSALATAGLFVARGLLPALLAPVLVARTERSERQGRLAWLYLIEAVLAVGLAGLLWRFWLPGVLILVAVDGVVAVAATALVRASAARIMTAEASEAGMGEAESEQQRLATEVAQRQANAALNVAFMFGLGFGPAIGGLLTHTVGGPAALLIDAVTFVLCSVLMLGVHSYVEEGSEDSIRTRLVTAARHIWEVPQLRALLVTEGVAIVFFASVEPVEVIYTKTTLGAGDLGFGLLLGAWGAGAALGAILFARAIRRPLGPMLIGGTLLVGLAYLGFAVSPTLTFACTAAVVGGVGNGIQWPSLISAVQQLTPSALHGRLMGALGSMSALCPAIGFALGGGIMALTSPRVAMTVAGTVATLATVAFLRLPLHGLKSSGHDEPVTAVEPGLASIIQ